MVRYVGLSKGCKACLQRKIKCDEVQPECTQCVSTFRRCPGAVLGNVFIDMTQKRNSRRAKSTSAGTSSRGGGGSDSLDVVVPMRGERNSPHYTSERGTQTEDASTPCLDLTHAAQNSEIASAWVLMPSSNQPSRAAPFQQLFVSQFVSAYHKRNAWETNSWYWQLPTILAAAPCPAVLQSIRALTMVYYAHITGDVAIRTEACRWYAKGLRSQRDLLQPSTSKPTSIMSRSEDVLSSLMFGLFELLLPTTPGAWIQHVLASAKLLTLRGVESCQAGPAHSLYRSMRVPVFFASLILPTPALFATEPWVTGPFALSPKTNNDDLIDIFLQVPGCLSQYTSILRHPSPSSLDPINRALNKTLLNSAASALVTRLQDWWLEYIDRMNGEPYTTLPSLDTSGTDAYLPPKIEYRTPSTAAFMGFYHAIYLILYGVLAFACNGEETAYYERCISSHCDQVLAAAEYLFLNGQREDDTVMVVSIFPLEMVKRWALDARQGVYADGVLGRWRGSRGKDVVFVPEGSAAMFYFLGVTDVNGGF